VQLEGLMLVSMTLEEADALSRSLYDGPSKPLTARTDGQRPLDLAWWRDPPKVEVFSSDRHWGALVLYCALGRHAAIDLPPRAFPSRFDFSRGKSRLPDKGFIKMCLNADPPILEAIDVQGPLVFQVTESGSGYLESE
jgi:hypothetical protein